MGIGDQMAAQAEATIRAMVQDFGKRFILEVERLFDTPELKALAVTAEIDDQFLASQIACMAVGGCINGFPGDGLQRRALLAVLHNNIRPENLR